MLKFHKPASQPAFRGLGAGGEGNMFTHFTCSQGDNHGARQPHASSHIITFRSAISLQDQNNVILPTQCTRSESSSLSAHHVTKGRLQCVLGMSQNSPTGW